MRKALALVVLAWLIAAALPAHAQDTKPELDGEAIWRQLQHEPIAVLPGAVARFDEDRVRAEMRRSEPAVKGTIYVVVAPFRTSRLDIAEPLEKYLSDDDVLITVGGVEVDTDWFELADGKYYGKGPEGSYDAAINRRHAPTVLRTYDVTAPLVDVLRLARGDGLGKRQRPPRVVEASDELVDRIENGMRKRLFVDPALATTEDELARFRLFEPDESVGRYRVVYLPPARPGRPVPDPLPGLTERFPNDTVVVVRGLWLDAAGPGDQQALATSLRFGRAAEAESILWTGRQVGIVKAFFDRLSLIRRGVLDPRGIPVRPPSVEETGGLVGPWAFAATGVVLGGASVGGWWWRRVRRQRAEQRAMRLRSAEVAAELARLAAAVAKAEEEAGSRRRAEAAERYATAVDLSEQATTSAELLIARDVIKEAHAILDGKQ